MTLPQVPPLASGQYTWAAMHLLNGFECIRDMNAGRDVRHDPRDVREKAADFLSDPAAAEYARCVDAAELVLTNSYNVLGPIRFDQMVRRLDEIKRENKDEIKKAPKNLNPLRDIVNAFKALGLLPSGMTALQQGYADFAVSVLNSENPVDHRLIRYIGAAQYLTHMMRNVVLDGQYLLLRGAWIAFPTWLDTVRDQLDVEGAVSIERMWNQILEAQDNYDPSKADQSLHSLRTLASSTASGSRAGVEMRNFLYAGLAPLIGKDLLDPIGTSWSVTRDRYQEVAREPVRMIYLRRRFAEDPSLKAEAAFEKYEVARSFFDLRQGLNALASDTDGVTKVQHALAQYSEALTDAATERNIKIHNDHLTVFEKAIQVIEEGLHREGVKINALLDVLVDILQARGLIFNPQQETWDAFITRLSQPRP